MRIFKIILIALFIAGAANAQNNTIKNTTQQESTVSKTVPKNRSVITYEVKPDVTHLEKKVLKNEVTKDKTIAIIVDSATQVVSLSFDTTKIEFVDIKEKLENKGYILIKKEDKPKVKQPVEAKQQMTAEKYNPEIDKFLNCEDVSIFKNNFMDLSDGQIHPRSRIYYQLIKNIYTLENLLSKNNLATIRTDLEEMGKLIDKINDKETSPKNSLPLPLLDYYKSLVKKYGDIYDQIYPNE